MLGPALNFLSLVEGIRPIHPVRLEDGETGFSRVGAHPRVVVNEDGYLSALRQSAEQSDLGQPRRAPITVLPHDQITLRKLEPAQPCESLGSEPFGPSCQVDDRVVGSESFYDSGALGQERVRVCSCEERAPVLWALLDMVKAVPYVCHYSVDVDHGVRRRLGLLLWHVSIVPCRRGDCDGETSCLRMWSGRWR